ncbi:hypothetical protein BGZ72_000715 [Mortierella alpina]|nr:hypothetical protein BGZ72_000715 [Mortierella alpina]
MLMKYIIALTMAAIAASQKLDDCSVALGLLASASGDVIRTADCVIPELTHRDCYDRAQALRVAFRGPRLDGKTPISCNYYVTSGVQLSTTEFLNVPAICSMLGGKIVFAKAGAWSQCNSAE